MPHFVVSAARSWRGAHIHFAFVQKNDRLAVAVDVDIKDGAANGE
jgi:hypothetical protein